MRSKKVDNNMGTTLFHLPHPWLHPTLEMQRRSPANPVVPYPVPHSGPHSKLFPVLSQSDLASHDYFLPGSHCNFKNHYS